MGVGCSSLNNVGECVGNRIGKGRSSLHGID